MNKGFNITLFGTALLLFMGACSSESNVVNEPDITAQIENVDFKLIYKPQQGVTKADDDNDYSTIGVFIFQEDKQEDGKKDHENVLFTAKGSETSREYTTEKPIQLNILKAYNIYAYSPYNEAITDGTVTLKHGDDFLFSEKTDVEIDKVEKTATADLALKHYASRMKFNLVPGHDAPDLTNATLKIKGFLESGTYNFITNTQGSGPRKDFITLQGDAITRGLQVIPGQLDLTVQVLAAGKSFVNTLSINLLSGNEYTYDLKVIGSGTGPTETELSIAQVSILPWEVINSGDIPIIN